MFDVPESPASRRSSRHLPAQQINPSSPLLPISSHHLPAAAPWRHADATHNTTPSPNPAEAGCLSRSEAEHLQLWAVGDQRRPDLDVLHLAADRQCQGVQTAEPTHLRSAVQVTYTTCTALDPLGYFFCDRIWCFPNSDLFIVRLVTTWQAHGVLCL